MIQKNLIPVKIILLLMLCKNLIHVLLKVCIFIFVHTLCNYDLTDGKVGNGEKSEVTSQSSLNGINYIFITRIVGFIIFVLDKDLFKCGQCIDSDGLTLLAGILELDDETILEIQKKYKKLEIQVYWLLKKWKQSNPGATKQDLIEIFEMLGFTKAIEK